MDVVISQDNQVVVSHDPFFSHEITTTPEGDSIAEMAEKDINLYKLPYTDIRKFDVGHKPHPRFPQQQKIKTYKPLLSELIDSVKASMITRRRPFPFYNIETKSTPATDQLFHPEPEQFVELILQVIREKDISDQCIIQSFDIRTLQYLHQHYPSIATALLIEEGDNRTLDQQLKTLGFTPTIYSPHYSLAAPATIQACHQRGMKIIPWTVNELATMKTLLANGVDGLISDYPNLYTALKQN
jgi:glycerophosphoryl diester phosphodiesterase